MYCFVGLCMMRYGFFILSEFIFVFWWVNGFVELINEGRGVKWFNNMLIVFVKKILCVFKGCGFRIKISFILNFVG